MWMSDSLNDMNKELRKVETKKKNELFLIKRERMAKAQDDYKKSQQKMLNPLGHDSLADSNVWSRTKEENKALKHAHKKLSGYRARHNTQQRVINFSMDTPKKKWIILVGENEIAKYCQASSYWKRDEVLAVSKDGVKINTIYYYNEQMEAVITKYLGTNIITTLSSFQNIIREMNGQTLIHKKQFDKKEPPAGISVMEHRERIDNSQPDTSPIMEMLDEFNN